MAFLNALLDRPDTEDPTGPLPVPPPPPPAPTPPAGSGLPYGTDFGHNFGGGGGTGGGPGPRPTFNFGETPRFDYNNFTPPSFDEAFNEPGFQFRLRSGSDALERSAAARGVLRTGGTLKDILEYGQNFGASEYQNAFNRALSTYDRYYQGRKDSYAPRLARWQMLSQAEIQAALAQFANENKSSGGDGPTIPPFLDEEEEDSDYY